MCIHVNSVGNCTQCGSRNVPVVLLTLPARAYENAICQQCTTDVLSAFLQYNKRASVAESAVSARTG